MTALQHTASGEISSSLDNNKNKKQEQSHYFWSGGASQMTLEAK
jgi:hypothetical protein